MLFSSPVGVVQERPVLKGGRLRAAAFIVHLLCLLMLAGLSGAAFAQQTCQSRSFSAYEERVLSAYIAYYGRPADTGGLSYWQGQLAGAGGNLDAIIDAFGNSPEYQQRFGSMSSRELIRNLYQQLYGRDPDEAGWFFYEFWLDSGVSSLASIAMGIHDGTEGEDIAVLENRKAVARHFVTRMEALGANAPNITDGNLLADAISNTRGDAASRERACMSLDDLIGGGGQDVPTLRMSTNGQEATGSVTGLSDGQDSYKYFKVTVPDGVRNLRISTQGEGGDPDLYVRRGGKPTLSVNDCFSVNMGTREDCLFETPFPGEYYILVYGYSAYVNLGLTVSWEGGREPILIEIGKDLDSLGGFTVFSGQNQYICNEGCESVSVPTTEDGRIEIVARPAIGALVTEWGVDSCSRFVDRCEFNAQSGMRLNVDFERATLSESIFQAGPKGTVFVDPETNIRVKVPANTVDESVSFKMKTATNERGEIFFYIDILGESDISREIIIEIDDEPNVLGNETRGLDARNVNIGALDFAKRRGWFMGYGGLTRNMVKRDVSCKIIKGVNRVSYTRCDLLISSYAKPKCGLLGADGLCISSRQPVILVHGFIMNDGNIKNAALETEADNYWNDTSAALSDLGYAPYVYRWRTAQDFREAASGLRYAVDEVRRRHPGKKPLIVAHSFGGLVARVFAHGLDSALARPPTEDDVLGIVTVGTPHSGIAVDGLIHDGVRLPSGVDSDGSNYTRPVSSNFAINQCRSINCVQTGRDLSIFEIDVPDRIISIFNATPIYGYSKHYLRPLFLDNSDDVGGIIFDIANPGSGRQIQVPFHAYYGLQLYVYNGDNDTRLSNGDGLISFMGQRLHPRLSCSASVCNGSAMNLSSFLSSSDGVFSHPDTVERLMGVPSITHMGVVAADLGRWMPGTELFGKYNSFFSHNNSTHWSKGDHGLHYSGAYYVGTQTGVLRAVHGNNWEAHPLVVAIKNIIDKYDSIPSVAIFPSSITEGEAGKQYTIDFQLDGLNAYKGTGVSLNWTLGDGTGAGASIFVNSDGKASHRVNHAWSSAGVYGIVVSLEETSGKVLATANATVQIGKVIARPEIELTACNQWKKASQGGYGVTRDVWDISNLPQGVSFDLEFDAQSVPDKLVLSYEGFSKLDTGWKGDSHYNGQLLYPGGVTGPGLSLYQNVFVKGAANKFEVTVYGPEQGTAWSYKVKCLGGTSGASVGIANLKRSQSEYPFVSSDVTSNVGHSTTNGAPPNAPLTEPQLTADAQRALFLSRATNLVRGVQNSAQHLYSVDLATGLIRRLSETAWGEPADGDTVDYDLATEAGKLVFRTQASNLENGPGLYLVDLETGLREALVTGLWFDKTDPQAERPALDAKAGLLGWDQVDASGQRQIHTLELASRATRQETPLDAFTQDACCVRISSDGRYLAWQERGQDGEVWLRVIDDATGRHATVEWPEGVDTDAQSVRIGFADEGRSLHWLSRGEETVGAEAETGAQAAETPDAPLHIEANPVFAPATSLH